MRLNFNGFMLVLSLRWFLLLCFMVGVFVHLGQWQYQKAHALVTKQNALNDTTETPFPYWLNTQQLKAWEYRKVLVSGRYEPRYQFLLDNQVHAGVAGYHVITPLKIAHTRQYVLVNRGWVPAKPVHSELPEIDTPNTTVLVQGWIKLPPKKWFTLESKQAASAWTKVQQSIDVGGDVRHVPISIMPAVLMLDAQSKADGFVRDWRVPIARIDMHLSYAYQWFGFAVACVLIYLYASVRQSTS